MAKDKVKSVVKGLKDGLLPDLADSKSISGKVDYIRLGTAIVSWTVAVGTTIALLSGKIEAKDFSAILQIIF